jgi:hypothetical protein
LNLIQSNRITFLLQGKIAGARSRVLIDTGASNTFLSHKFTKVNRIELESNHGSVTLGNGILTPELIVYFIVALSPRLIGLEPIIR